MLRAVRLPRELEMRGTNIKLLIAVIALSLLVISETIQAHLLNMVLTKNWIREFSPVGRFVCGLMLAGLAAWLLLGLPGWQGLGAVVALLCGYIAAVFLALPVGGVLLPVVIPVAAVKAADLMPEHVSPYG